MRVGRLRGEEEEEKGCRAKGRKVSEGHFPWNNRGSEDRMKRCAVCICRGKVHAHMCVLLCLCKEWMEGVVYTRGVQKCLGVQIHPK